MKTLAMTIVAACISATPALAQTGPTDVAPAVRISGVVELPNKDKLRTAAVTITRTDGSGMPIGPSLAARMYPDGAFFFVNVDPGRYLLKASAQSFDDSRSMYTTQDVTMEAAPLNNMHLILREAMPVAPPAPATSDASFSSTGVPPLPAEAADAIAETHPPDSPR